MPIGRNDPCPCGSGKKYKKCCLNKQPEVKPAARLASDDDMLAPGEISDYGPPNLNQQFFIANPMVATTPQGLLNHVMLEPELMSVVTNFVRQQDARGKDEVWRIKKTDSVEGLIQIMKESPDPLNHHLLIERILERADEAVPKILAELVHPQPDGFTELAIQVIYRCEQEVAGELLALVTMPMADAYDLSLVCMLLGMVGTEMAIKPLWDCFHFFKEKFPHRTYLQGPLIGLYELSHQSEEPLEVSDEMRQQVERSLRQSGCAVSPSTAERIAELLLQRRRIETIKVLCEESDVGLKQAKDAIDQLQLDLAQAAQNSAEDPNVSAAKG